MTTTLAEHAPARHKEGDGAPKSANLWCPRSFWDHGGRLSARQSRRPYGTGPRFSPVRHARMRRPILQLAPSRTSYWVREELRCRPGAHVAYTSPQAPHLAPPSRTPRDDALQLDEVMHTLGDVLAPGIRPDPTRGPLLSSGAASNPRFPRQKMAAAHCSAVEGDNFAQEMSS